jgi:hypothetical protein
MTMIDEQFLKRVYRSSFWWSLLILSYLMMSKLISASAGFAIGVALALGVLRVFEIAVKYIFTPGNKTSKKVKLTVFSYTKYFALGVIVATIVRSGWISLPAFACGVGVPSTIIFLKTLSQYFHQLDLAKQFSTSEA